MVARTSDRIALVVNGNPQPVSQALALTAYRVTQEKALTNFLKHAGSEATAVATLTYSARSITVDVVDNGDGVDDPTDGGGNGLRGMYERVSSMGGSLSAGPRDDGPGFRVHAVIPIGDAARTAAREGNATMSSDTIRVFLADDQALVRSGFRMLIDSEDDLAVTGEAQNGADAVTALLASPADVVLMDIRMPVMDGVEATRRIVEAGIETRVLVLTTFDLDEYAFAALKAGASGFMLKDARPADLLNAIRNVAAGDAVVAPSTTRRLLDHVVPTLTPTPGEHDPRLALLTEREREVLLEVAGGSTNAGIAKTLYMAEGTVKTHIGRLLTKLQARDRVGLVLFAYENGLAGR